MKMTLDFVQGICFGIQKNPNWAQMLKTSRLSDIIEDSNLRNTFEQALAQSIDSSYEALAVLEFKDLDSDTVYLLKFNPNKKKWVFEIKDSKEAEVSLEEKNVILKDETVSKTIKDVSEIIFVNTSPSYTEFVMPEIEAGSFLSVDEAKAEAVNDFLQDREMKTEFEKKSFVK